MYYVFPSIQATMTYKVNISLGFQTESADVEYLASN